MSELVLLVEPGSGGAQRAIDRVRTVLSDEQSVALIAAGNHEAAVTAVGHEQPMTPSVILTTSGSTGAPRAVEIPRDALLASAERAHERLGGAGVWLTAIPVTGAGGLNTVLRSLVCGTDPVIWPGIGGAGHFDGGSVLPSLQATRERARALKLRAYTSLVPTQLARLVAHAGSADPDAVTALGELARFDAVLVGADALDSRLHDTLHAYGIPVVTTYGATETSGGCIYDGVPLRDVEVELADEPVGRITISGPTVARQYRNGDRTSLANGRWVSNDIGEWRDGRLTVVGRHDDVIKLGGIAIALNGITESLRAVDGVTDLAVLARPDAEWGQIPVAYVVGHDVSDAMLRQAAASAVGRNSIPMDVIRLRALPLLPNGKLDRQTLMEM